MITLTSPALEPLSRSRPSDRRPLRVGLIQHRWRADRADDQSPEGRLQPASVAPTHRRGDEREQREAHGERTGDQHDQRYPRADARYEREPGEEIAVVHVTGATAGPCLTFPTAVWRLRHALRS